MSKTTEQRVIEITSRMLGIAPGEITPESKFEEDLGADSLDQIEITMEVEEEFEIDISDERMEQVSTVQQAIDLVTELTA